jgi:cell division protein FtsZ
MALNLTLGGAKEDLRPRITVFGVGGAGGNAVNNMIEQQLEGVEFVVANTDAQALQQSLAEARIQMGLKVTEGLGAGARPSVGAAAAEETIEEIVDHLAGTHMCFITAGMGGGTGTGAAPIIAQAARELGVLTVGVVTKPFQFEGHKRMRQAEEGIEALQKVVDTLIIIPNQNLFRLANDRTTFTEAFAMADNVLYQGVKGISDLMVRPGLINLDFADVRSVMDEMGKAMMGTGEAEGDNRAVQAAEKAIANPLLDEISLNGAKGVLINITGGDDMTLFELDEAANIIREKVDPDANIIVGSTLDPSMAGALRVSVVATGIDASAATRAEPAVSRSVAQAGGKPVQAVAQLFDQNPAGHWGDETPSAAVGDDLPPPAYRPQAAPHSAAHSAAHSGSHSAAAPQYSAPQQAARSYAAHDEDAGSFIAPRPRPAGTPSPEALRKLQAAVSKVPQQQDLAAAQQRPVSQPRPAPEPAPRVAERPRFGIGSLINRMAGGTGEPAPEPRAQAPRQQPQVNHYDEEQELSADQERIEIPAFLRRQAN